MDQLPRKLGLLDATFIVVGVVIGSGIFLLPNLIARAVPSGPVMLGIWVAAGLLSWCGALAYAELGAMMPATGGQYVYVREAFGPCCAFVCGWVFVLAVLPAGMAFLAVGFSIYLDHFVPLSPAVRTAASLALLWVLSGINYIGVRESSWTQRIFTSAKILGLVAIIGAAVFLPHPAKTVSAAAPLSYSGIGYAMTACLMAYNGWSYVSFVAGEVKDPQRNLPRALGLGMAMVMALYVGANAAYLHVLAVGQIAAAERVGAVVAERTIGPAGAAFLSAVVLLSVTGAMNGNVLAAARIPFAQARDGNFFARFGTIHPRFETPAFAIAMQALWTSVLIVTGSYETLFSYALLSSWVFYTLGVVAVWVLRRKMPDAPRPYRMWGYPVTLWLFVLVSTWFVADALVNQTRPSLIALGVALAGIPFYYLWRRSGSAIASHRRP